MGWPCTPSEGAMGWPSEEGETGAASTGVRSGGRISAPPSSPPPSNAVARRTVGVGSRAWNGEGQIRDERMGDAGGEGDGGSRELELETEPSGSGSQPAGVKGSMSLSCQVLLK